MTSIRTRLEADGYAVVRGVLGADELREVTAGFERLVAIARELPGSADVSGARFVVDQDPFRLHRVVWCGGAEPALARYGADERFVRLAVEALGTDPVVQILQQAHFKLPGDGVDFAWHQDASNRRYGSEMWRDVDGRGSFVQMVVAVDGMDRHNGGLALLPDSQRLGFVADPQTGALPEGLVDESAAIHPALEPGDVLLFGPFLIHGSAPNRSDGPRRLFLQGYAAPGANARWYPGCGEGVARTLAR